MFLLAFQDTAGSLKDAAQYINDNAGVIHLLSMLAAAAGALILYTPLRHSFGNKRRIPGTVKATEKWGSDERWAKFFVGGVIVWSIQYSIQSAHAAAVYMGWVSPGAQADLRNFENFFFQVCSSINNLLFLGAARALLIKKPVVPKWAAVFSVLGLVGVLENLPAQTMSDNPILLLVRFPDVLFSAYCLFQVGYATVVNVRFHMHPVWALIAAAVAGLYAAIHIAYGFNPAMAYNGWTDNFLPAGISKMSEKLVLLDTIIFAVALPLKFGLIFPAYFLLMQDLVTFKDLRRTLYNVTHKREEYLSRRGIISSIGSRLGADSVALFIRLPGKQNGRLARLAWSAADEAQDNLAERPGNGENDMRKIAFSQAPENVCECFTGGIHLKRSPVVAMPIYFHGAVVGCLRIEKDHRQPFSTAAIQQIKEIASLVTPAVQSFRELATLDWLSRRIVMECGRRAKGETPDAAPQGAKGVQENFFTNFVEDLAYVLNDTLSPLAYRLDVRFGFNSIETKIEGPDFVKGVFENGLRGRTYADIPRLPYQPYQLFGFELIKKEPLPNRVMDCTDAAGAAEQRIEFELGEFIIALPAEGPDRYPAIGTNFLHRKAISSLVADGLFDYARAHFGKILRKFSEELNRGLMNIPNWFEQVQSTVASAGMNWVVYTPQEGTGDTLGPEHARRLVEALIEHEHFREHGFPKEMRSFRCDETNAHVGEADRGPSATRTVICAPLRSQGFDSQGKYLWFGVEREGFDVRRRKPKSDGLKSDDGMKPNSNEEFGAELDHPSPWRIFLDGLIDVSASALERFSTAQEIQQYQIEAARSNAVATMMATAGTLLHQVVNMARNQESAAATLADGLKIGRLRGDRDYTEVIASIGEEAERQMAVLEGLIVRTSTREAGPCKLYNAADQASKLFQTALLQQNIKLDMRSLEKSDFTVDVPLYVASLTFSNLISNAKDAIGSGGVIRIEAEDNGEHILCHVTDSGPSIAPHIAGEVFNLGVTTKAKSGGWGLYLVSRSLAEHGAEISIGANGENGFGKTFTIRFPKPKQEQERTHDQNGDPIAGGR